MALRRTPIRSVSVKSTAPPTPDRPYDFPWAVIVPDGATLDIDVRGFKGLKDDTKDNKAKGKKKLNLKPGKLTERHVLAVTLDGDVEFVPISEQRPVYYAHLGFYDPATDDFNLLEFFE